MGQVESNNRRTGGLDYHHNLFANKDIIQNDGNFTIDNVLAEEFNARLASFQTFYCKLHMMRMREIETYKRQLTEFVRVEICNNDGASVGFRIERPWNTYIQLFSNVVNVVNQSNEDINNIRRIIVEYFCGRNESFVIAKVEPRKTKCYLNHKVEELEEEMREIKDLLNYAPGIGIQYKKGETEFNQLADTITKQTDTKTDGQTDVNDDIKPLD